MAACEHVERALGVGPERLDRCFPRAADVGPTGEVVHDLGPDAGEQLVHGIGVGDVDATLMSIDADDIVALVDEMAGEMPPDESESAGDEGLHWLGGRSRAGDDMIGESRRPVSHRFPETARAVVTSALATPGEQPGQDGAHQRGGHEHEDERHPGVADHVAHRHPPRVVAPRRR